MTKWADQKYCYECAAVMRRDAQTCRVCGAAQPELPTAGAPYALDGSDPDAEWRTFSDSLAPASKPRLKERRNKTVAAMLALFLGWFGAHKFYLGQTRAGILYLAFFWTLVPWFVSFAEGLMLLAENENDFQAKYG